MFWQLVTKDKYQPIANLQIPTQLKPNSNLVQLLGIQLTVIRRF
ncbi:hypothetical protein [Sphaerospermopsis sp. FACHB-1094]|nr:hypothetical protein [Sphaerospermopsis sp. FACHB-1094]